MPRIRSVRTVGEILSELASIDAQRLELIAALGDLGFRTRGFVGEYGELLAAAVYPGSQRAPQSQPGYDLVVEGLGQIQVKTLRSTPTNYRTSMGAMRYPYDVLFALRLDVSYQPVEAWEIPRAAVESVYPHGTRTSLTHRLTSAEGVRPIGIAQLRAASIIVASS